MKKIVLLILVLAMVLTPLLAQEFDDYAQGKIAGEADGKGSALWLLAGAGCGVFGFGAALLTAPNPPTQALVGKSSNYVLGYTEGYKKKAKGQNVLYAGIGWVAWIVIYLAAVAE